MKKISLMARSAALCSLCLLSIISPAGARPLANFSEFAVEARHHPMTLKSSDLVAKGHRASIEEGLGVPSFLWAETAVQSSLRVHTAGQFTDAQLEQQAREHLSAVAGLYRLDRRGLKNLRLHEMDRTDSKRMIAKFTQEMEGIEVFGHELSLLMKSGGELVAIAGYLSPFKPQASAKSARQNAVSAIIAAFKDYSGGEQLLPEHIAATDTQQPYQWYRLKKPADSPVEISDSIRVKRVYYLHTDRLEPAYYLEITGGRDEYGYVVSALDSHLLQRSHLTDTETFPKAAAKPAFTYRVWAETKTPNSPFDGPQGGDESPFPGPKPNLLPLSLVPQNTITVSCLLSLTCDSWMLNNQVSQTVSNNTRAYADISPPNGFSNNGDFLAETTTVQGFDYPYNFSLSADADTTQMSAAIVQAFYTTNFMHDLFYIHGFNEKAGNGQTKNYGRGGRENDVMRVETQDYSGLDNANMSTLADGASSRMQLYLWNFKDPRFTVSSPASLAGEYSTGPAEFGAVKFNKTGRLLLVDDGVGTSSDGCDYPYFNEAQLAGNIALIDRGNCLFVEKAQFAQASGAVAVVIANNEDGNPPYLSGSDESISIPAVSIAYTTAELIKTALSANKKVNVTLKNFNVAFRDSALDNTIVSHEWTHFLASRLIGNGNGLNSNQAGSLAEGWSDFVALILMVKEEDRKNIAFPKFTGTYAMGSFVWFDRNAGYFGIRRYPYSTDKSKNPLTFKHIQNNVALPANSVIADTAYLLGEDNSEVHNSGEIWALMLWEAYAALLNDSTRLTFVQAQNRMLDYLVASLKLTPINPTFTEARDALLNVAKVKDVKDYALFWKAFAKRGMGVKAVAPGRMSVNHAGVVEDYSTP